jgi:hypothetical protein
MSKPQVHRVALAWKHPKAKGRSLETVQNKQLLQKILERQNP